MKRPDDLMLRAMEQAAQLSVAEVDVPFSDEPEVIYVRDLLSAAELERVVGVVRRVFAAPVLAQHGRLRALRGTGMTHDVCVTCAGCPPWPCPTVRALGDLGEDAP